ncbi:hypothetical protein ABZ924_33420 [Streptomyces sp. NPDC046876]|uniref:hypothetical protein n=1 Tax=Streptomyces sp. NPDC046876 TaxID=3155616 RepID=UPI0033C358DA
MGGILDPNGNLHRLPIALVDKDQGPPLPGQQQALGAQVSRSVVASTPAGSVQWRRLGQGGARWALDRRLKCITGRRPALGPRLLPHAPRHAPGACWKGSDEPTCGVPIRDTAWVQLLHVRSYLVA